MVHLSGNADQKVLGSIPTPLYVEFACSCWGPGFRDVCCLLCPAGGVEEPVIGYSWRCRWTHLSASSCCSRASMVDRTPVYSCVLVLVVTLLNHPYNKHVVVGHFSHFCLVWGPGENPVLPESSRFCWCWANTSVLLVRDGSSHPPLFKSCFLIFGKHKYLHLFTPILATPMTYIFSV